jgi:DNA repair exonuclease SbcCD ATPase subunit
VINSIELQNFQSHENSKLNLHPGINTIIGSSDSGKSAVLRAINWAIYNRPSGGAFISHWAKDKKGKQIEKTIVSIIKNKKDLMRARDSGFNGYDLDGKILEAIGTDVPDEVKDFFNISEVNIQKQHDKAFLLSESSGEVARFFNRIIKLDVIDKSLSLIDSKKRENEKDLKNLKAEEIELTEQLETYNWIEDIEPKIVEAEKIQNQINEIGLKKSDLENSLNQYKQHKEIVEDYKKFDGLENTLSMFEDVNHRLIENKKCLYELQKSLNDYNRYKKDIEQNKQILSIETAVERYLKLDEKLKKMIENKEKLANSIKKYQEIREKLPIIEQRMKEYEEQLPDICPTCNGTGRLK